MKTDENWQDTRILAKDLSDLLDIPMEVTETFLTSIENLLVHKFLEKMTELEDCKNVDVCIELPYLGSFIVSFDEQGRMSYDFVVRKILSNKLKNAYMNYESPLSSQVAKVLGEQLADQFEKEGEDEES